MLCELGSYKPLLNASRILNMELKEEIASKSTPKIKKAASKIFNLKFHGYEEDLLSSLKLLIKNPKSWQTQSEIIKALGVTGSEKALTYLKELVSHDFISTILYRDLGFSICLLNDIPNNHLEYTITKLNSDNDLLLSGICAAILYSEFIPSEKDIKQIIVSVENRDSNEGNVLTPRCYIAAACYSWPSPLTGNFLDKCTTSTWQGLVEIAHSSLRGKKSKYVLI